MNNNSLVSIIMTTFNREDYICEAIESVFAQTFHDFELIIIDDGSTDNTKSVVEPYLQDKRLAYYYQLNTGQIRAQNIALKKAKGEFVCFLDSDNIWLPHKLEASLETFQEFPEIEIVHADIIIINERGDEVSRKNMRRFSGKITTQLLKDNCVAINTSMVRRRCFDEAGGFNESRECAGDYDLWLRFSIFYNFRYIPDYFVKYRVMQDQISSDKNKRFRSNEETLKEFMTNFAPHISSPKIRNSWAHLNIRKARYYSENRQHKLAILSALEALRFSFTYFLAWRTLARVLIKILSY